MKKVTTFIITTLIFQIVFGQISGNINYQNQVRFSDQNNNLYVPSSTDIYISVKGLVI